VFLIPQRKEDARSVDVTPRGIVRVQMADAKALLLP